MSDVSVAQPFVVVPPGGARTNALAIVSFVTSIIGFGLVGVITGHIALSQIKKTHEQGRGLALAGVIIGYVSIAAAAVIVVGMLSYAFLFYSANRY